MKTFIKSIAMNSEKEAWQYLIDVVFNGSKDVPIELVSDFRKLASVHQLELYCDFLRGKRLPSSLKNDPWEWAWLKDLSNILPKDIKVLVLKGAAGRDLDLYQVPLLRQTSDVDIFIYGLDNYGEQKSFISHLLNNLQISLLEGWKKYLKKLGIVVAKIKNNTIDIHFNLFSPLGNTRNPPVGSSKRNKELEDEIMQRSFPFRSLKNVFKMSYEDFWLYNIFHFVKNYPIVNLGAILDSFLLLKENKTTTEKLQKHAEETKQQFLCNAGLLLLAQLSNEFASYKSTTNCLEKEVFRIEKINSLNKYNFRNRILTEFVKGYISAQGNLIFSFIHGAIYLILNNLFSTDEKLFSLTSFSNTFNKTLYTYTKLKNFLKRSCLKLAGISTTSLKENLSIIQSKKRLITLGFEQLKLTFLVPLEFYSDLERMWKDFLDENHQSDFITIERLEDRNQISNSIEMVLSDNLVYVKLANGSYGKASLSGSGTFYAKQFWDVRTFALFVFRAITFEKETLLLVHSGAVNIKNQTLIFPAGSSAGKTTFFNILVKNGAIPINDDTILLKEEDDFWYVCPTPFRSRNQESITSKKYKLDGIIDLVKVTGGHEIIPLDEDYAGAVLLNNSLGDFITDDAGFITSKVSRKVLAITKQLKYLARVKFSIEEENILLDLFHKSLVETVNDYKHGSRLLRLIEYRGRSMEPTFKDGDIFAVEEVYPHELRPKDVICYTDGSSSFPVIHRVKYLIKNKSYTTVITKGDNKVFEDPPELFKRTDKVLRVIIRLLYTPTPIKVR